MTKSSSSTALVTLLSILVPLALSCIEQQDWKADQSIAPPTLRVLRSFPVEQSEDVPLNSPIWLEFDQYLEVSSLEPSPLLLESGSGTSALRWRYHMVDKRLLASPITLQADFRYRLSVDDTKLRSVEGASLRRIPRFDFRTGNATADWGRQEPAPSNDELEAIFDRSCSCHRLDPWPQSWYRIPRLDPKTLFGLPSWQAPEHLLVRPGAAWNSYLMFKALPDYPHKQGSAMPPAWAKVSASSRDLPSRALDADELRRLEAWINAGAASN
ncbi:MAG: hypothetical protein RBU37_21635 [Myxococcota bacterium]|nr:hypothetical protein [Myxococcota bacterium]